MNNSNKNQEKDNQNYISRVIGIGSQFIDYRMAIGGGIAMGIIVFLVNFIGEDDIKGAITASLKQGIYTFLFGGMIMKGCERLATHVKHRTKAITLAIIIPSIIAVAFTFGVHSLKGTPKPIASTIPTVLLVIPSTTVWAFRKRKKTEVTQENNFPVH